MRLAHRTARSLLLLLFTAAIAPYLPAAAQPSDPGALLQRCVIAGDDAYLLLPPELVSAPLVEAVLFSPGGRYALVRRGSMRLTAQSLHEAAVSQRQPPGEVSLIWWDSQMRAAREVWKADSTTTAVERIEWLPGSEVALVLVREGQGASMRQGVLRVTRSMARAQVVVRTAPSDLGFLSLHVSPNQPLAVVDYRLHFPGGPTRPDGVAQPAVPQSTLTILDQSASLGTRIALPAGMAAHVVQWDPSGNPLLLLGRSTPGQERARPEWYALSPRTGQLRPVGRRPTFYQPGPDGAKEPAAERPLRLKLARTVVKEAAESPSLGLLWLESAANSEKPRTLVCADGTSGQLLSGESGVLYQSQGALWVAPLLKMNRAEFTALNTEAVTRARQALTLNRAKQIGLAMLMYAQDHQETLPGGEEIQTALDPYLKQNGMLDGFTYTLGSTRLSAIEKPSETELGWIMGSTGRVILYVDGHVKAQD